MHPQVERMETLSPSRLAWQRALADPSLENLPYKIETNEFGQLVMSPTKFRHSRYAGRIVRLLHDLVDMPGDVLIEVGIDTPKGVKVPDVAWASEARIRAHTPEAEVMDAAPQICIEVLSRSNTRADIEEKRDLFLSAGAEEFWTCDVEGKMRFFGPDGELQASRSVPGFPLEVILD